jgi:hypothetical protein
MCRKTSDETPDNNNAEVSINSENTTDNKEINVDELFPIFENIDVDELSVELFGIDKAGIDIKDTDTNKFIGYVNFDRIYPELYIGDVHVYEKFIVLEDFSQSGGGFNVYEYNKGLKYSEYKTRGKKLYDTISKPYWFKGISDNLVFSDVGTGPGIREIEIFDLANNTIILKDIYYMHFWFSNDIVHGLAFTEWKAKNANIDDYLVQMYYTYLETTEKPEEKDDYKGLFKEFILRYDYNILTKEITNLSGEYIYSH